jgi:hypothetical protein
VDCGYDYMGRDVARDMGLLREKIDVDQKVTIIVIDERSDAPPSET